MAGKKIDRVHARSALETVRENPGIALIAAAPALVVLALVWWLLGFPAALILLIAAGGAGYLYLRNR
nr:hypothetical protein [uncultured Rhodococcus sp.]